MRVEGEWNLDSVPKLERASNQGKRLRCWETATGAILARSQVSPTERE